MKRSEVVTEIHEVLKPWENCMLERKLANQILAKLEKMGLITPPDRVVGFAVEEETGELHEIHGSVWEKEGKQEMPKITHVLK